MAKDFDFGSDFYKKQTIRLNEMKFKQLDPDSLAALYTNRPSRKRVIIDSLLSQLDDLRDTYIEEAIEKSDMKDAKAVIAHIMGKK